MKLLYPPTYFNSPDRIDQSRRALIHGCRRVIVDADVSRFYTGWLPCTVEQGVKASGAWTC
jgi:hypothetical protein